MTLGTRKVAALGLRGGLLQRVAAVLLGDDIVAQREASVERVRHRLDAFRVDAPQLLEQREHGVQLPGERGAPALVQTDAREVRDRLHVIAVESHGARRRVEDRRGNLAYWATRDRSAAACPRPLSERSPIRGSTRVPTPTPGPPRAPSPTSVDERLTALELKLMDVERTVEALDAVILRQARDIETLRAERARLEARVESLATELGETPSVDDERPPHY